MRLSEWRAGAPHRDSMTPKVMAVVEPVLKALGAEQDPHAWIFWGDDPEMRYMMAVVTAPGLITANVRVNVPQEGPRVSAKLVRWSRVQVGDLGLETAPGGHLILGAQVEGNVFRATDAAVPDAAAFVLAVLSGIDGRSLPDLDAVAGRRGRRRGTGPAATARTAKPPRPTATRPTAARPPAARPSTKRPAKGG
jgi:hypothetical protein